MRTLYTVCYPELAEQDHDFIEAFRQQHDLPYKDIIPAHFTMVFGVRDIADDLYVDHVNAVARSMTEIQFTCRYAMLGADDADETAYVFLVPDEGYSAVSLLHDHLYTGPLERFHRLDIPYVPHITIASLRERVVAKALCGQLNRAGLSIAGRLKTLTIGALQDGRFSPLHQAVLGKV